MSSLPESDNPATSGELFVASSNQTLITAG